MAVKNRERNLTDTCLSHVGSRSRAPCGLQGRKTRSSLLHFMAGWRKRQLNQNLFVLYLILVSSKCVLCCSVGLPWLWWIILFVFSLAVVLVRLSVPVQVTDWKDSSRQDLYNVLTGTLNPAHSLSEIHSQHYWGLFCKKQTRNAR